MGYIAGIMVGVHVWRTIVPNESGNMYFYSVVREIVNA